MTLDELSEIHKHLAWYEFHTPMSSEKRKELIKSIWVIKREIELKTKCTSTKYSNKGDTGE